MKRERTQVTGSWLILILGIMLLLPFNNYGQTTFVVTSTTDPVNPVPAVEGELRWAIQQANANLTGIPSIITFKIPGTGPFTINLKSTLPVITKPVYIYGTTQPGYDFNNPGNPIIIIDGTITSTTQLIQGLSFNDAPGSKLTGIYIKSFNNGLTVTLSNSCEFTNNVINRINQRCVSMIRSSFCTFKGNYINTDKDLTHFAITGDEGIIFTQSNDNIIGGTNCGEGNTIAFVRSEGIDNHPIPGQRNLFSGNVIFGCTLNEIFIRGSGNGGKTFPTITTTGCITSGTSQPNDVIQVFGSTGPADARRNARVYMGTVTANSTGNWSIALSDIKYPFVTATATNSLNNTSELCFAKAITIDSLKLAISKPSSICLGEQVEFENAGSKCLGSLNFVWNFGDGSNQSSSSTHTYTKVGTYTVTVTVPQVGNCPSRSGSTVINVINCGQFDCPPPSSSTPGTGNQQ
ncbi:MAG: PKD domain-containing protein [Bacteroidota bacterium]